MHPHNVRDSSFYLKKDDSGEFSLSMNYDYYFQIQGQLVICDLEYSDFVCWTLHVMHCERIVADTDHFLKHIQPSLDNFFLLILLPRLLTGSVRRANDFTVVQPMQDSPLPPNTYCWCSGKNEGKMVACNNEPCPRQWFHIQCVGISHKPQGKWFCSNDCKTSDTLSNAS